MDNTNPSEEVSGGVFWLMLAIWGVIGAIFVAAIAAVVSVL